MADCRVMETRTCPLSYGIVGCDGKKCARFEIDDLPLVVQESIWKQDVERWSHLGRDNG